MATLDDKILGEKLEYYCSSDEEVDEDSENEEYGDAVCDLGPNETLKHEPTTKFSIEDSGRASNTGPKGVIKDWQRFKQLETEKRIESQKERTLLAQKLSMTCRSTLDDEAEDAELEELLSDKVLLEFAQKRMQEMMSKNSSSDKVFGTLVHLKNGEDYLQAIDKEAKSVTVILHVYEDHVKSCRAMNSCLEEMSKSFPYVKFCKMSASTAGLSTNFKSVGVPALLIYKAGDLIGNFVGLGEEFGLDFTPNDVENFLLDRGIVFSSRL